MTIEERTAKIATTFNIEWPCFGGSMERLMAAAKKEAEKADRKEAREEAVWEMHGTWLSSVDVYSEAGRAAALENFDHAASVCSTMGELNALKNVFFRMYIFPYQLKRENTWHGWEWANIDGSVDTIYQFQRQIKEIFHKFSSFPSGFAIIDPSGTGLVTSEFPLEGLVAGEKAAARWE